MAKATIIRLFVGGVVAVLFGAMLTAGSVIGTLAGGVVEISRSDWLSVNGGPLAWTLVGVAALGLLIGSGGAVATVISWVGALLNTVRLEDKTWFFVLLACGLFSLGVVGMVAYAIAGPDSTTGERASFRPLKPGGQSSRPTNQADAS